MLEARAEIDSLRQRLTAKNLSGDVVDLICDEASRDISTRTADVLADSLEDAVRAGEAVGSEDFINELKAVRSGPSFEIITDSGRTDFSEAPFPMLPKLLKNAKVAKDGSLYKVIPMRTKSTGNNMAVTTEAALANINAARRIAKEQRDADRDKQESRQVSPDSMKGMDTLSAMQAISRSRQAKPQMTRSNDGVSGFRTASSKQDASSQWVQPGKMRDVSKPLREINMNLHDSIDQVIQDVIQLYDGMY